MKILLLFLVAFSGRISAVPGPLWDACVKYYEQRYSLRTAYAICSSHSEESFTPEGAEETGPVSRKYDECIGNILTHGRVTALRCYNLACAQRRCKYWKTQKRDASPAKSVEETREQRAAEHELGYPAYYDCLRVEEAKHDWNTSHELCKHNLHWGDGTAAAKYQPAFYACVRYYDKSPAYDIDTAREICRIRKYHLGRNKNFTPDSVDEPTGWLGSIYNNCIYTELSKFPFMTEDTVVECDLDCAKLRCKHRIGQSHWGKRDVSAAESDEGAREQRAVEQGNPDYRRCIEQAKHDWKTSHELCAKHLYWGKRDVSAAESVEDAREQRAVEQGHYDVCMQYYRQHYSYKTANAMCAARKHGPGLRPWRAQP